MEAKKRNEFVWWNRGASVPLDDKSFSWFSVFKPQFHLAPLHFFGYWKKKRLLKAIIKTIQMFTLTSTLFVCASANPSSQYLYREKWQVSVKHSTRH